MYYQHGCITINSFPGFNSRGFANTLQGFKYVELVKISSSGALSIKILLVTKCPGRILSRSGKAYVFKYSFNQLREICTCVDQHVDNIHLNIEKKLTFEPVRTAKGKRTLKGYRYPNVGTLK